MIQGTNADQDKRFSDKEKKLMKSMKFEDSLLKKVSIVLIFFLKRIGNFHPPAIFDILGVESTAQPKLMKSYIQRCGSALFICESGSTKFDECGSKSRFRTVKSPN